MARLFAISSSIAAVSAQSAGSLKTERHPALSYEYCDGSGCDKHDSSVVIDSNWRWTHVKDEATNCYTGNEWDSKLCPDAKTCSANCEIEGADEEYEGTYGVKTNGDEMSLQFVTQGPYTKNIGSRLYLMKAGSDDEYKMFKLKNREFSFTVDDKDIGCGLNGALYFVSMEADGGKKQHGNAGAKWGSGYCDAQCPHDLKWINNEANVEDWVPSETDENAGTGRFGTCCTEIDLWEANSHSTAYTMHSCDVDSQTRCKGTDCGDNGEDRFKGVCDKNGCDIQSYRLGQKKFWGRGSGFTIDSTKPVTVTTQFITDNGKDDGKLVEVRQTYTQNGKTHEHPMYTVNGNKHDSISDEFCADWVAETKDGTNFLAKGGLGAVDKALEQGVVLVMSLWDDHYANMLWLDSTFPVDADESVPGAFRGECSINGGVPADIEEKHADSTVVFSGIKYGRIGTTVSSSVMV